MHVLGMPRALPTAQLARAHYLAAISLARAPAHVVRGKFEVICGARRCLAFSRGSDRAFVTGSARTNSLGRVDAFDNAARTFAKRKGFERNDDLEEFIQTTTEQGMQLSGGECTSRLKHGLQILKKQRNLRTEDRQRLSGAVAAIFARLGHVARDLKAETRADLLSTIASLGMVFAGPEWRTVCPPVPVALLDLLLDTVLMDLRELPGFMVGLVVIALEKLQLQDPAAYAEVTAHVREALAQERESDYTRGTFARLACVSMLMRGFGKVHWSIPSAIPTETMSGLFDELSLAASALIPQQQPSKDTARALSSIADCLFRLPEPLDAKYPSLMDTIARYVAANARSFDGLEIAQVLAAFAAGPYANAAAAAALCDVLRSDERQLRNPRVNARIAAAMQTMAQPPADLLRVLVDRMLDPKTTQLDDVSGVLAAAAAAGACSASQVDTFLDAGGRDLLDDMRQPFNERSLEATLAVLIHAGRHDDDALVTGTDTACSWIARGQMPLWRISSYMQLYAHLPNDVLARQLFSAAVAAIPAEAVPQRCVQNRCLCLRQALGAAVAARQEDAVVRMLAMPELREAAAAEGGLGFQLVRVLCSVQCRHGLDCSKAAGTVWSAAVAEGDLAAVPAPMLVQCAQSLARLKVPAALWSDALCASINARKAGLDDAERERLLAALAQLTESPAAAVAAPAAAPRADSRAGSGEPTSGGPADGTAARAASEPDEAALKAMTVAGLKEVLQQLGAPVSGTKAQLIERILSFRQDASAVDAGTPMEEEVVAVDGAGAHDARGALTPADEASSLTYTEASLGALKVAELRDILRRMNAPVTGAKALLIERIMSLQSVAADPGVAETPHVEGPPATTAAEGCVQGDGAQYTEAALKAMKVAELKDILKGLGAPVGGNKAALVDRVLSHQASAGTLHTQIQNEDQSQNEDSATAAADVELTREGLKARTVAQLSDILKERNLPCSGTKAQLIDRILSVQ